MATTKKEQNPEKKETKRNSAKPQKGAEKSIAENVQPPVDNIITDPAPSTNSSADAANTTVQESAPPTTDETTPVKIETAPVKLDDFTITIKMKVTKITDEDCATLAEALRPVMESVNDNLNEPSKATFEIIPEKIIPALTHMQLEEVDFKRKCANIEKQFTGISNGISVIDAKKHVTAARLNSDFTPNPLGGMNVRLYLTGDLTHTFHSKVIYGATAVPNLL